MTNKQTKKLPVFHKYLQVFLKRIAWFLFFIILGIFLSKILFGAQQGFSMEERILQKLEIILKEQSNIRETLNKLLSNQEQIKKELEIIKIRATLH